MQRGVQKGWIWTFFLKGGYCKERVSGNKQVFFLLQVVSLLLNYGADITLHNKKGETVLDVATDSMRPLLLGMLAMGF